MTGKSIRSASNTKATPVVDGYVAGFDIEAEQLDRVAAGAAGFEGLKLLDLLNRR